MGRDETTPRGSSLFLESRSPNRLRLFRKALFHSVSAGTTVAVAHPAGGIVIRPRIGEGAMLWTIFVLLVLLWLAGMVSSYTLGGFIHILLLLAVAVVLINIIQGRRPVI